MEETRIKLTHKQAINLEKLIKEYQEKYDELRNVSSSFSREDPELESIFEKICDFIEALGIKPDQGDGWYDFIIEGTGGKFCLGRTDDNQICFQNSIRFVL